MAGMVPADGKNNDRLRYLRVISVAIALTFPFLPFLHLPPISWHVVPRLRVGQVFEIPGR